ncbi:unnamed protein product [Adineta steineri]|uniref:Uncharacterized protein n=1 Tax=Adineta steineri TaxID=433720 RepID=A0A819Y5I4_9BILA|nr:unnamed protein product [Adineta steineri]
MSNGSDSNQKALTASPIVHVRFLAKNALFSSISFKFACQGYRVSLSKKQIATCTYKSSAYHIPLVT